MVKIGDVSHARIGDAPARNRNTADAQKARRDRIKETGLGDIQKALRGEPFKVWEDVSAHVRHVGDFAAAVSDARMMSNGGMNVSLYTGTAYSQVAVDACLASARQFTFVRVYTVDRDVFIDEDEDAEIPAWLQ